MATTRLMPLHVGKGRSVKTAISKIIGYVKNPEKTDHGQLVTSFQCNSQIADAEFLLFKKQYIASTGRIRGNDDVIAYHLRQSFVPGEISAEEANRLGVELARRFTKGNHAFIVCTHIDRAHIHNHIIWSAVNLECNRKFRNFWGSSNAIRKLSDTICIENGYSIVEHPKGHGKSYDKWMIGPKKRAHRETLRTLIDGALEQKPHNFDELLEILKRNNCEVARRGKSISLRAPEWENAARMDSLGDGYTEADLRRVLSGECNLQRVTDQPKLNLLVDIQSKLKSKGIGYARWAKTFNLKQMAQTLIFLKEHNLLEYEKLNETVAASKTQYHKLRTQVKDLEKRLLEISELRRHIINYAKTREVYVAYRKAGYSKEFYADHTSDILLHYSAKQAFDELGLPKLPTVKELRKEYSDILSQKRKLAPLYYAAKKEMKELLIVKANVDQIMENDKTVPEKKRSYTYQK